ncbi:MAG TPA: hypothetical protein VMB26_16510 [Candidatus Binataceae bacterium]|nr:hypothetical protein [Candidatus Binataceae bacterium]
MRFRENQTDQVDDLSAAILWIHVLSGAIWIGACVCLAIAVSAIRAGSDEFRDFAARGVPTLNRINLVAAVALAIAGMTKLLTLIASGFRPSAMFIDVLFIKIGLFFAMAMALGASMRAAAMLEVTADDGPKSARAARKVAILSGLIAAMGGAAMLLGLWLVGS